jgi:hypothetical protein
MHKKNMATMNELVTIPPLDIIMLSQRFVGKFADTDNRIAGLDSYDAQPSDEASSTTTNVSRCTFDMSPVSSTLNYRVSPNGLEDSQRVIANNDSKSGMGPAPGGTPASTPRTRSSTGGSTKQRQTYTESQAQTHTQRRKQQLLLPAAAAKSEKSAKPSKPGTSKSSCNGRKAKPRTGSLERNRIAASKCRQKKKEWLSDFEANKSRLEMQYKVLKGEYSELLDEITRLKNFLVIHAGCNDPYIDGWIKTEANSYIRRLSQNYEARLLGSTRAATQCSRHMFNCKL